MQALLDAGADRVSLADTVGYADPHSVSRLFEQALKIAGDKFWCGHFHDTRGLALANVYASLELGVARFDASLAGIGGCPHAPGASGNGRARTSRSCSPRWASTPASTSRAPRVAREGRRLARRRATPRLDVARRTAARIRPRCAHLNQTTETDRMKQPPTGNGLPLDGIRVIEFTHMVMGPTCGMILADLGAEVIKIEPPGGDKTRNLPGLGIGFFRSFNRNKKSVVLDINSAEGHATVLELIGQSDVMLENFRPGLMNKLGLGYETLAAEFPKLIYVSHKGFLPGPYEKRLALDEVVQMMGGLSYMTGPVGRPLRAGTSVNDIMGGMFGAIGVLAALRERERTGRGQEIQSALFENCAFLSAQHMQQFQMTGEPRRRCRRACRRGASTTSSRWPTTSSCSSAR